MLMAVESAEIVKIGWTLGRKMIGRGKEMVCSRIPMETCSMHIEDSCNLPNEMMLLM